jgi:hypothetical protein
VKKIEKADSATYFIYQFTAHNCCGEPVMIQVWAEGLATQVRTWFM